MTSRAPRYDDARVHLRVLGHDREVKARVRVGEAQLTDILPLAQAISNTLAEVGEAVAVAEGKAVSCRAGCGACCRRHVILLSPVEAVALARRVRSLPAKRREVVRRRFAATVRRLEALGLLDRHAPRGRMALQVPGRSGAAEGGPADAAGAADAWWEVSRRYAEAVVPCPFLEDEKCSIYEDRPLVCREFLATTPPERCLTFDSGVETTPRLLWMSDVLADVAAAVADLPAKSVPLPLALEWAEVHGARVEAAVDGEDLFRRLTEILAAHAQEG